MFVYFVSFVLRVILDGGVVIIVFSGCMFCLRVFLKVFVLRSFG